ncbi:unnamed protein product [Urochloa humidicola]
MDFLADQIESLAGGALHGTCGDAKDLTGELLVVVPPSPISSVPKNCWLFSADEEGQDKQEDGGPVETTPTRLPTKCSTKCSHGCKRCLATSAAARTLVAPASHDAWFVMIK